MVRTVAFNRAISSTFSIITCRKTCRSLPSTAGGVWTNKSSRQGKENISDLTVEEALAVLSRLEPVHFNYKADADDEYVGFIAEDVPEMVASKDRTGLSAMDIVAVLTKVVQAQQERIEELEAKLPR